MAPRMSWEGKKVDVREMGWRKVKRKQVKGRGSGLRGARQGMEADADGSGVGKRTEGGYY